MLQAIIIILNALKAPDVVSHPNRNVFQVFEVNVTIPGVQIP